jgi:gamma-glutamyltranspeptidase/glutathione hydrolase
VSTRYRPVRGARGAVVAGHPAAVAAGLGVLERGGHAVDAAIASAAAVAVARPHMSGIGGDGFLLVYDARAGRVTAVNAGGPAPAAASPDRFPGGIPDRGPLVSTVPGIVDGWGRAWERFGRLPWAELLAPAIELAERGLPVYESLAAWIRHYGPKYAADPECARTLMPKDRPPVPGESLVQEDMAGSLRLLATHGARELYEGELARAYVLHQQAIGGLTSAEDLRRYAATVAEPVSARYRGHVVHSQPPMSQGWMLVQMLATLEPRDLGALGAGSAAAVAAQAAAVRRAFADRDRCFGDPRFVPFRLEQVLARRDGDTTSLSVVDAEGNAVSMIQSLWVDAGVMVPGTGILLNARLNSQNVTSGHPDCVAGGKTPVYTMHTFMVTRDGALVALGGTPGGQSQVQTNLQVVTNLLDFGLGAQEAVEAPRFVAGGALHFGASAALALEGRVAGATAAALAADGWEVTRLPDWAELNVEGASLTTVGSAKIIALDPATGARALGVDPRRDAWGGVTA